MPQPMRISRSLYGQIALALILIFSATQPIYGQVDIENGKKLYKTNCASCHKLDKKLIGPALGGIMERRSEEWLILWIRDNAKLRASGDADANAIFDEYNGSVMQAFPQLSTEDIQNIIAYCEEGDKKAVAVAVAPVLEAEEDPTILLVILGAFLVLFLGLLIRVKNTLKQIQGDPAMSLKDDASYLIRVLANNRRFMTFLTVVLAITFLKVLFSWMMGIGVQQSYEPIQPIAYSHKVHAGDNAIDCNYCHSSARSSRIAGIPSANVCMNCHMYIDGSEITDESGLLKYHGENSPEIAKIYAAIGWDPVDRAYIKGYEQQPIRWIRVHNLPDFTYFNHAQHVTAGKVACQTCHGPVEAMEIVFQYSELTMGWCINCHRETKVKTDNGFYDEASSHGGQSINERLAARFHDASIMVEDIGGLECGKCHY